MDSVSKYFDLARHQTSFTREVFAGLTTFLTMSYILVVQPSVLSTDFAGNPTGLDAGAVLLATAFASAIATLIMGVYAKLPLALAPGMGQNFFFITVIMSLTATGIDSAWRSALAIVLVAGVLFLFATLIGVRQLILDLLSPSLRAAIAVGIGLFIAFIGLKNGGVLVDAPSLVTLNATGIWSTQSLVFWAGLGTTLCLTVCRFPGSILMGICVSTTIAWATKELAFSQVWGLPQVETAAAFQLDFGAIISSTGAVFVAMFLFMDIFDTTGTLVGVTQQAGIIDQDGNIPRIRQAMIADAVGTIVGACLGTSTVTTFIESAAGVQQGGRTGLTAVTTALLFLLALLISPLVLTLGAYPPITAPALVLVGSMMFRNVQHIDWSDDTEAIPAFLVIAGIPLFFSIADGIAVGLIIRPLLKLVRGRFREVSPASIVLCLALIAFFAKVRSTL